MANLTPVRRLFVSLLEDTTFVSHVHWTMWGEPMKKVPNCSRCCWLTLGFFVDLTKTKWKRNNAHWLSHKVEPHREKMNIAITTKVQMFSLPVPSSVLCHQMLFHGVQPDLLKCNYPLTEKNWTHLHHSCSKGTGTSTRSRGQWFVLPQPTGTQFCWTTVLYYGCWALGGFSPADWT